MRVLVEQTRDKVREALDRAGALWDGTGDRDGKAGVHVLMGGAAADADWTLYPEERAVFIGTQDMLLSRALNRGYAASPARWPLEFGLLSHDALWVMDEVQLMDVGLATGAQLQAYHEDDEAKGFRPRRTWWMSATLQPAWLRSVDTAEHHDEWVNEPIAIPADQRQHGLGAIQKSLAMAAIPATDDREFADYVAMQHAKLGDGAYGRITLIVCNTVDRARRTFDAIQKVRKSGELVLVHGRFRPQERDAWRARFLDRAACRPGVDRIIVATQVVEAGVDISAGCVVSELAPWSSLVQRFGRCARYGGTGHVHVVERGRDEKSALPYDKNDLDAAWNALESLVERGVGIATLEEFEEQLDSERRSALFPYEPQHLLLRRDLDELFDTTPDLTGAHLDIGRFIRSGDERDVQVFWLDLAKPGKASPAAPPPRDYRPRRDELCNAPFLSVRVWLCGKETKDQRRPRLLDTMRNRAWTWDWLDGKWVEAERAAIVPGRIVCIAANCGGYDVVRGFDPDSKAPVAVVPPRDIPPAVEHEIQADEKADGEDTSFAEWKTLACHGGETAEVARQIAESLRLPKKLLAVMGLAALWHDFGKVHPAFQGAIRRTDRPAREDLAKAPKDAWLRPKGTYRTRDDREVRPGFRHELASALAVFAVLERHAPDHEALLGPWAGALQHLGSGTRFPRSEREPTELERAVLTCSAEEIDLLVYLVASHHGKVRVALHASPKDQDYRVADDHGMPIRGVREGDVLPSVVLEPGKPPLPQLSLTLEPASLGLSRRTGRSWRERTLDLQARYGPGALAWLEGILISADRRASRLCTVDPALALKSEGAS